MQIANLNYLRNFTVMLNCSNPSSSAPFGILKHSCLGLYLEYSLTGLADSVVFDRACYSKMAEELCALLVDTPSETLNLPMGCLLTMLNAPVPDESRSSYLQDTLSVFTEILCSDP